MIHKRFRFVCTVRVLLIGATIAFLFYFIFQLSLYAVTFITALLIVYQVYALIQYVERTNRDLNRFIEAIRYEDFSQTFVDKGMGSSYDELKNAFNEVLDKFKQTRAQKEEHYQYLLTVVKHVGIGLISFDEDGGIQLINAAAKRMFKIKQIKNIRALASYSEDLVNTLLDMDSGGRALVKVQDEDELIETIVYATHFILRGKRFTLVSIQNIQSELEEKEMEAWQKLIRVLTHEIMNSVTPIASLASTVSDVLHQSSEEFRKGNEIRIDTIDDVSGAVQTIQKRSKGLLHFVDSYRNLTRIPRPDFQIFPVSSLFQRVEQLMGAPIRDKGIAFTVTVDPESLELTADVDMVEQILINLLKNAVEALGTKNGRKIDMRASLDARGRVLLQVADNGPGILKEVQEKIFIPFFSTKKRGTGIGLALARQVMRMHRGTIGVRSNPDEGTVFTLRF